MDISPVFFTIFAAMAIGFSLLTVFKRNPVSSAFSLVMVFFSFAGIYALLGAHLVAALQILVYTGAIMVLFVFVIMLLNADAPSFDFGRTNLGLRIAALASSGIILAGFIWAFRNSGSYAPRGAYTPEKIAEAGGNTRVISEVMFSEFILPFELTSVLLLAGIVCAIAIAKRRLDLQKKQSVLTVQAKPSPVLKEGSHVVS